MLRVRLLIDIVRALRPPQGGEVQSVGLSVDRITEKFTLEFSWNVWKGQTLGQVN